MGRDRLTGAERGGILIKFMVLLAVLFAAAALAWMVALPHVLTSWVRNRTGFDVSVESMMINPFNGQIAVRGLAVNNPPTFPQPEFLQVRELSADAEFWTLFSNKAVIRRVALDVGLVALVKRADGRTNVEVFRSYLREAPESRRPGSAPVQDKDMLIRRLDLRFDRLLIADYTSRQPVIKEYPLNIRRSYRDITNSRQLLLPSSLNQIFALGGAVGNLLPDEVGRVLDDALRSGTGLLRQVTGGEKNAFNGFSDTLEESKKP